MQVLERDIENKAVREIMKKWPRAKCRKMNGFGNRSWPDRLILLPSGKSLLIEFKRPGGELSPGQRQEIKELRALGHRVAVCESVEEAIRACLQAS